MARLVFTTIPIANEGAGVGAGGGAELRAKVWMWEIINKSQRCLPFACHKIYSILAGRCSRRRLGCH